MPGPADKGASSRRRVLHVVRRYAPLLGGTETYVRDLAEAQALLGHSVTVVTLDHDVTGVVSDRLPRVEERNGVRVVRLPGVGSRRFALTSRPWTLAREISTAHVVHLHDIRFMTGLVCLLARLRGRRVFVHTHGLLFHTKFAARLKRFLMRTYYGPVLRLSRATIVADSGADRDILLGLVPYLAGRVLLLDDAIRLDWLLDLPRTPVPGRVVAFGRISETKRLDRLIAALSAVRDADWHLWLAGAEEPSERRRLEDQARDLGVTSRISWRGVYTDQELAEMLSSATVAAFPSPGEGFGLALLEAMASGTPVVANDIPAHRGVLGESLTETVVDFGDRQAAAAELERLLCLDLKSHAELSARERARARTFDVSRLAKQIEELYESFGARS